AHAAAERHELDCGGIVEESSSHGAAVVGVEAGVRTSALVEEPEPGVHGVDTADEATAVHHRVQSALGACHGGESHHQHEGQGERATDSSTAFESFHA